MWHLLPALVLLILQAPMGSAVSGPLPADSLRDAQVRALLESVAKEPGDSRAELHTILRLLQDPAQRASWLSTCSLADALAIMLGWDEAPQEPSALTGDGSPVLPIGPPRLGSISPGFPSGDRTRDGPAA